MTSIFKIPAGMETSAQWAVFLIGLTVASTFPGALFGGALGALSRYDMLNLTSISVVVTRALLWWWVVKQGWGVVGVAAVRVLTDLVLFSIHAALAWRLYGGLRLRPRPGELKPNLRTLFSFSVYSFLLSISTRLVFASDKLVAGILLGPIAVTFYTIGISLTEHLRALLFASTSILVPLATSLDAKKDEAGLRNLLVQSSRMNFLLILPGLMAFFVIGTPFIELWMGLRYAETSGTILALLTIPVVFAPLRNTCSQLLYGMNRHRMNAFWSVGEAVANLGLSILLAIKFGLIGIAIGTLIPAVIAQGFAVPIYTARYLGVNWPLLYWRSLFRPALVAAPYLIVLVACRWLGFTKSWVGFVATVASGLIVYVLLVWFGLLSPSEKEGILQRLRSIFRRTALSSAGAP